MLPWWVVAVDTSPAKVPTRGSSAWQRDSSYLVLKKFSECSDLTVADYGVLFVQKHIRSKKETNSKNNRIITS
jgi:hypothetical protein